MSLAAAGTFIERWLDEIVISGTVLNHDGDNSHTLDLPPGTGDCAIMELEILVSNIATLVANPELLSWRADVISADATTALDILGSERLQRLSPSVISGYISPDPLVLWRQSEVLRVIFPEVDTNAVPTGDLIIRVKVVRVRPQADARQPVRLVR